MISIIVTWRDRLELRQALPGLCETARSLGGDLTVVNFGGDREILKRQLHDSASDVYIVDVENQRYFNKSCAQNLGAVHTENPLLFFCDCDIVIDPSTIRGLVEQIHNRPSAFATLARTRESETNSRGGNHVVCFGYELKIRTPDGRELHIVDNEEDAADGSRQAPGLLMVRRTHFHSVNGYNSRLCGWGWEDQDMIARLTLGSGLERIIDGAAIHISHDDTARVRFHPIADRWESRDKMFRTALANYDRADFQGTCKEDKESLPAVKHHGTYFAARQTR